MAYRKLFVAHALATFGNRMWEFAVAVLTLDLFSGSAFGASLLPVALYGVSENLAVIFFGPCAARFIDRSNRLQLQRVLLTAEDLSLSVASGLMLLAYSFRHLSYLLWALFSLVMLVGSIGNLAATTSTISMEKDWVTTLAHESGSEEFTLNYLNSMMRRIDLMCKIVAPMVIGLVATLFGPVVTLTILMLFNFISWPVELGLSMRLYDSSVLLQSPKTDVPAAVVDDDSDDGGDVAEAASPSLRQQLWAYLQHDVVLSSIAYALLYGSLLGTGSLATAYLRWRGLSEASLAAARAVAALCGIGATAVVPSLVRRETLSRWGIVFLSLQLVCLVPVLGSFVLPNLSNTTRVWMLLTGIVLSRFGLWAFDLVSVLIMQLWVSRREAGAINGVQSSFISIMYLWSYVLGIMFPDPAQFIFPTAISIALVLLSLLLFSLFHVKHGSDASTRLASVAHSSLSDISVYAHVEQNEEPLLDDDARL